jgi:cyclase
MKKIRVIPVLILRHGEMVQSYNFESYKVTGNALKVIERFSKWDADEIIYLDISSSKNQETKRQDLNSTKIRNRRELITEVAKRSTMPLTFGGGLKTLRDIEDTISLGADKVSINSLLIENAAVVEKAIKVLGSQAIVASVDYKLVGKRRVVWHPALRTTTDLDLIPWIKKLEDLGVGEILLTSVDRDGTKAGYDLDTLKEVCSLTSIPVIANGGVGTWSHFKEGFDVGAEAVAAANIFHFYDQSIFQARRFLFNSNLPVRKPSLSKIM